MSNPLRERIERHRTAATTHRRMEANIRRRAHSDSRRTPEAWLALADRVAANARREEAAVEKLESTP